jgi:hypothetical protein
MSPAQGGTVIGRLRRVTLVPAASRCLLALVIACCLASGSAAQPVRAQSPSPTAAAATGLPGGDTRSEGEGAGLVGQPVFVAAAVVLLGAAAAGITVLYVRLSREE